MDKVIEKKNKISKKTIWISVSAILAILVFYNIVFGDKSSKLKVDQDKVSIETVQKDLFKDYIAVIGTVEPIRTIYLDAIEGGRVEEILIEEGNMVEEGDVILRLSNNNLMFEISSNEAEVSRAINDLRTARLNMEAQKLSRQQSLIEKERVLKSSRREYNRNKELYANQHISKETYEQSEELFEATEKGYELLKKALVQDSIYQKVQLASMKQSVDRLESNLAFVQSRLENLQVKAPVDGELASLNPEIGQVIGYGTRIGTINILDNYKLHVEIDEHYISRVTQNLPGSFDYSGDGYGLKLTKIYPEVTNGRFGVDMEFTNGTPDQIRIGQTFRIKLELGESKDAVLIPRGGFYQSTGGQWVYVLTEGGDVAVKRSIRIGRQNPQYYEVLEGLEPGEKVIVSSYDNFGDKDKLLL
ncbi:MAG: efflux RND transporter periplasmic adaptor subunit, partial [Bacteroidota bacterium]